jgi:hypothetical protein
VFSIIFTGIAYPLPLLENETFVQPFIRYYIICMIPEQYQFPGFTASGGNYFGCVLPDMPKSR